MRLFDLPSKEADSIKYFQECGILPTLRKCTNQHDMKLYMSEKQNRWRCNLCRQETGIRPGTWFETRKISFTNAIRFIYLWCNELTSIKLCQKELDMSPGTVVDWNYYLREICTKDVMSETRGKIGGPGLSVEVDESVFSKRKNKAGRIFPPQCFFGGLCRETKEIFLVSVANRSADSLVQCIKDNIHDGSTIYADCLKSYKAKELEEAGFSLLKINHKYNFIDTQTGSHTQNVERLWRSAKIRNKKQRGTVRHHFSSYLSEFIWKQKQEVKRKDCFQGILEAIAKQHPPETTKTNV